MVSNSQEVLLTSEPPKGLASYPWTNLSNSATEVRDIEVSFEEGPVFSRWHQEKLYYLHDAAPLNHYSDGKALTVGELESYSRFMLYGRIQFANEEIGYTKWNQCSDLILFPWQQNVLYLLGVYHDNIHGRRYVPRVATDFRSDMSFEQAMRVSSKIGTYRNVAPLRRGAIPKYKELPEGKVPSDLMTVAVVKRGETEFVVSSQPIKVPAVAAASAWLKPTIKDHHELYEIVVDSMSYVCAHIDLRGLE